MSTKTRVCVTLDPKTNRAFRIALVVLGKTQQDVIKAAVDDTIRRASQVDIAGLLRDSVAEDVIDIEALLATLAEAEGAR